MKILHIAEIDNDISKGTSSVIPEHFIFQYDYCKNVYFLNCNDEKISKLYNYQNCYSLKDNKNMELLEEVNPDIVIFHEVYKPNYLKIYKYCIKKQIPYIIIPHGCLTKQAQNNKRLKKILGNFLLFNSFINNACALQFLSINEKNNSVFHNKNSYVLGNGITDIPKENLYLKKTKVQNNMLSIIYVGRYDYMIKGIDQLLEACKIIHNNKLNNIKINLYGLGNKKTIDIMNKFVIDNCLTDVVTINGPIYSGEKRNKIISSDLFIQVSRSEGQPLGVIEALSLGVPVILSQGTGYEEIINKENFGLCTRTDGNNIFEAILKVSKNPKILLDYSKNAYEYAVKNYSWGKISKFSIEKYDSILKIYKM